MLVVRQRLLGALRWLVRHRRSPSDDMVLLMTGMVLTRTSSMVVAAVCSSLVALEIWVLTRPTWPLVWICLEALLLLVRYGLIQRARKAPRQKEEPVLLYVASGLAWSAMIGLAGLLCALSNDAIVVLLAAVLVMGVIGAITARNSPIPRAAVLQLLLVSLPYLFGIAANFHSWEIILAVIVVFAIIGMIALTERLHDQVLNLILAERDNAYLAYHDVLTGLPNRAGFNEHLTKLLVRADRAEPWFAVLYLDLDGFKGVNDTLGHAAGDMVLRAVADRLRREVGDTAFVARLSGDEFAALLPGMRNAAAQDLARRIIDTVAEPIEFGAAWPIRIGVSVGITSAPEHGRDPTLLLSRADAALYAAKAAGKGLSYLFTPGLDRRDLLTELKEAMSDENQLLLFYQPILCSRTGTIVAREALLRWRHPRMGLLPPSDFIPVAEQSRLIVPLGELVLGRACRDAARWTDGARVAVNVSPRQLGGRGLVEAVVEALRVSGLPNERLEIELGETSPLLRTPETLNDLKLLRDMRIQIALDDFPTGYSSLAALDWFAFDRIKIDGDVLRRVPQSNQTAAILRATVALAQELGIRITGEGIETEQHLSVARMLCFDELQGYLLGRPQSADSLEILNSPEAAAVPTRSSSVTIGQAQA
jgi:diguanylate cyclase (GGDEF)-like protein